MIVRTSLDGNFTKLPNDLLHDPNLSFDAVTVMARLLSLPPDWKVCLQNLRRRWGCGLERLKKVMRELIAAGWVQRQPSRKLPNGSYSGGDYKIFNVRQPVQKALPLDDAASTPQVPEDHATACAVAPESAEPESVTRTPNKDSNPTKNPPYPPAGGARAEQSSESGRAAPDTSQPRRTRQWRVESPQACRGAAPPAAAPETLARFHRLLTAYPESGRLASDQGRALAAFVALSESEQAAAIGAAGTEARIRAQHRAQARALHRWLERGLWRNGVISADGGNPGEARNAAGLEAARRGQWPVGCTHLVLAATPAGEAWEAYFARFDVRPRWMQLTAGLGAFMPAPMPPVSEVA